MKKQLDNRWRQIDKFEASLKVFAETKAQWRKKLNSKEGELEALRATNSELSSQLSSLKRPGTGDTMEVKSLATRANNAERRLNNAQNQLVASEEKISLLNQRNAAADEKWEARVREYESRLKAAEEKVKRERQGGKERAAELERNVEYVVSVVWKEIGADSFLFLQELAASIGVGAEESFATWRCA
jgi:chromosome segregation ATPase